LSVGPDQWWWRTLIEKRLSMCEEIAERRQANAERRNLAGRNDAPNEREAALQLHRDGVPGEAAWMLALSPCYWAAYEWELGKPDIEDTLRKSFKADVKTMKRFDHCLIIQADDDPDWVYPLACSEQHPRYALIGWCYGRDVIKANSPHWKTFTGRPAFFVPANDPILRPPAELRKLLHGSMK
jgi:hypothetical protein